MKNEKSLNSIILVILMLTILMTFGSSMPANAQAARAFKVCVVEEPITTNFPDVTLEFLALDDNFRNMTSLQLADIEIKEEGNLFPITSVDPNPGGTGLNLYFVIDRGNRTDQATVKAVMARFANKFMVDGLDRVSIVSSEFADDTQMRLFGPSSNTANLSNAVTSISSSSVGDALEPVAAFKAALNNIRDDAFGCSRPNVIVAITGEDIFSDSNDFVPVIADAQDTNTRIFVVNTLNKSFGDAADYEKAALDTKGLYLPLRSTFSDASSDLDVTLFEALTNARYTYTVTYRSTSAMEGTRNLSVVIGGTETAAESAGASYSVALQAPLVTITNPIQGAPPIVRTGQKKLDSGEVVYDKNDQLIEWQITWPDNLPRNIMSITIVMKTVTGEETIATFSGETNNAVSHSWDLRSITPEGDNPRDLRIIVEDELGMKTSSEVVAVMITNIKPEDVIPAVFQWQFYALYGFLGLLLILFLIFFKKIKRAFAAGGAISGVIDKISQTVVYGKSRRRNPIAKLEVLRPTTETKSIFVESVKLGRDPNVSDYTFFSLNSECSVSGEHAHLVKKRNGWVIIAVSASKSPVFVDNQQINLHEEVPLKEGQKVELGYEDLGSAMFIFHEVAPSDVPSHFQPDDTRTEKDEDDYRKTKVIILPEQEGKEQGGETNVLLGELDTFNDMTRDQDDFDALFDDMRGSKK
jgi:hypothetical protein